MTVRIKPGQRSASGTLGDDQIGIHQTPRPDPARAARAEPDREETKKGETAAW